MLGCSATACVPPGGVETKWRRAIVVGKELVDWRGAVGEEQVRALSCYSLTHYDVTGERSPPPAPAPSGTARPAPQRAASSNYYSCHLINNMTNMLATHIIVLVWKRISTIGKNKLIIIRGSILLFIFVEKRGHMSMKEKSSSST